MAETVAAPGVTVVVPTLNRGAYLLDTVRDLLAQHHRPLEILIVDQSDTVAPELEALAAQYPDIISHHRVTFRGLPIARNFGWQVARHEIIVYVDDDIRCGPTFVSEHVRTLVDPKVLMSAGGIDEANHPEPSRGETGGYNRWLAQATRGFHARGERNVLHAPGGNFASRRSALREASGVDEQLSVGAALFEETDLALRLAALGGRIRFNGAARLTHLAAGSGGTRQPDYRSYVFALAHNRSVMVRRHSRWYQWPLGLAWSAKLIVAYTRHARDPRIVAEGLRGMAIGWAVGGNAPLCTRFEPEVAA
jgi:GT2 family glycosyltransferase